MVTYNSKNWLTFIFHSYSREIMKRLLPAMLLMSVYTGLITFIFHFFEIDFMSTTAVHSILGIVLGFFLVFRTNTSYDRWWEGRKVWGQMVNSCRNLSLKLSAMVPTSHPFHNQLEYLIVNYPKALKEHLRNGLPDDYTKELHTALNIQGSTHYPNSIARELFRLINVLKKNNVIDAEQYRVLDNQLTSLTDITGVCERIKNTPIPYSYIMFMKKFILAFMMTLPFAFVTHFGYWTIGITILLLYILLSIELLAEEIEDPFGTDLNDLPIDNLAIKIKANVEEILSK